MRFKRNVVSLGSSDVSYAKCLGSEVHFYMTSGGCTVKKSYDLNTRALKAEASPVANAGAYLRLSSGSVQDLGEVVYVPD